jgi:hypothetical protein
MVRLIPLVLAALLMSAVPTTRALAAQAGGGGGPRTGFTCDVSTNKCTCEGTMEGADCRKMKKNCSADSGTVCTTDAATGKSRCTCTLERRSPVKVKKIPNVRITPAGGIAR